MKSKKTKQHIGQGIGYGLGLVFGGIFLLNLHQFYHSETNLIVVILGVVSLIFGIIGILTEMSKRDDLKTISDSGFQLGLFLSLIIVFYVSTNFWIKSILAFFVYLGFWLLGTGIGNTLFDEKGIFKFKFNSKSLLKFIITLITSLAAILSAVNSIVEKSSKFVN